MGPAAKRRKLNQPAVEEVLFDPAARKDYLTGFHKRKVQRTKAAREAAAEKARQEKIEDRKKLRDERKADLERHVKEVNALLPKFAAPAGSDSDADDQVRADAEWSGLGDVPLEPVDHEAEYIDEDKYITVTVEEVDISRDGISRLRGSDDEEALEQEGEDQSNGMSSSKQNPLKNKAKEKDKRPKKKKKAFRYESPAARKLNRVKERAKKSKQARARKGE